MLLLCYWLQTFTTANQSLICFEVSYTLCNSVEGIQKKIRNSLNLTLKDFFGLDDERDESESFAQTHVVG